MEITVSDDFTAEGVDVRYRIMSIILPVGLSDKAEVGTLESLWGQAESAAKDFFGKKEAEGCRHSFRDVYNPFRSTPHIHAWNLGDGKKE
ncbi:MAG: hypothetical protein P4L55_21945 [Syntrophobacteraceae bacterium]|nr:hypothetical protein [Syntrophobacteraceae bacterium]